MTLPDLTPDCRQCDALCCVLLAFDHGSAFGFDKPACAPCRNLAHHNACRIHANLQDHGFAGCVAFNCHGAGQRLTSQVFRGRSWRQNAALLSAMDPAFRVLRQVHEALAMLQHAAQLPLTAAQHITRQTLLARLSPDWTEAELQGPQPQSALHDARAYFASLRAVTSSHR